MALGLLALAMYISCIFHVVCASFSALAMRILADAKTDSSGIWALESCWFKLNLKFTTPILLAVIYKPPKIPVGYTIRTLTGILSKIQPAEPHELYILGDFSLPPNVMCSK